MSCRDILEVHNGQGLIFCGFAAVADTLLGVAPLGNDMQLGSGHGAHHHFYWHCGGR